MAARRPSDAERFAQARQEFVEAMARGCTIPELREAKARERSAAAYTRLRLKMEGRGSVQAPSAMNAQANRPQYWWERD